MTNTACPESKEYIHVPLSIIQISTLLDSKRIHHRDAELDEDWYEFDVTGAVSRWIRTKPKKTRYAFL